MLRVIACKSRKAMSCRSAAAREVTYQDRQLYNPNDMSTDGGRHSSRRPTFLPPLLPAQGAGGAALSFDSEPLKDDTRRRTTRGQLLRSLRGPHPPFDPLHKMDQKTANRGTAATHKPRRWRQRVTSGASASCWWKAGAAAVAAGGSQTERYISWFLVFFKDDCYTWSFAYYLFY